MQNLEKIAISHNSYPNCFYFKNQIEENKNTIVFLHGFAESSFIWENIYTSYIDDYNLIIPELPGSGISKDCPTTGDLVYLAKYVLTILEKEKINTCIFFGHSMGGYIGMEMLNLNPNLFEGFGLVHSSAFADSEEKKLTRAKAIEIIKQGGKDKFYYNLVHDMYNPHFNNEAHLQTHYETAKLINTEWTIAYYAGMMNRKDHSEKLKNYNGKTLVVIGKEDKSLPYETALRMSYLCNNTMVEVINNCGHFSMFEQLDNLTHIIHKFLFYLDSSKK